MIVKKNQIIFLFLSLFLAAPFAGAQEEGKVFEPKVAKYDFTAIPKDPFASILFNATFPGMGELYNKEYLRGVVTGIGFWGSFFSMNFLFDKLSQINTDTFLVEDTGGAFHQVIIQKDQAEWVGLESQDKVFLISALVGTVGFYVWGLIDAYKGAHRYNKKLMAFHSDPNRFKMALGLKPDKIVFKSTLNF